METEKKPAGVTLPGLITALERIRIDMDAVYAWHAFRDDSPHADDIRGHMERAILAAEALHAQLRRVHYKRGPDAPAVTCCRHGSDPDAKPPCKLCALERKFHVGG